jgi:hypothetical protein
MVAGCDHGGPGPQQIDRDLSGQDIKVTISANAACLDAAFTIKYARAAS